jgi:hypothetical protein
MHPQAYFGQVNNPVTGDGSGSRSGCGETATRIAAYSREVVANGSTNA